MSALRDDGAATAQAGDRGVIRVMVVDDSAVIRGLVTRALEADPEIQVVASASDGRMAISAVRGQPIDVAVVDIEMPNMDGLTAIPLLLEAAPRLQIIMASTLTRQNAEVSLRALRLGAKDYVPKPSNRSELTGPQLFQRELIAKIKALAGSKRSPARAPAAATRPSVASASLALRPMPTEPPEVIAIGASTGGPQALLNVLAKLPPALLQPILITQHMPATFTTILAEHLQRAAGRPCREARDGEALSTSVVYIAPGDFHMVVEPRGRDRVLRLLQTPPENFCRPSVDPMLRSLASIYGRRLLTLMLTGMGQDGLKGAREVVQAGGYVAAQDEASSVVWGMPGAVATAGLCSAVIPLDEIGAFLRRQALGRAA